MCRLALALHLLSLCFECVMLALAISHVGQLAVLRRHASNQTVAFIIMSGCLSLTSFIANVIGAERLLRAVRQVATVTAVAATAGMAATSRRLISVASSLESQADLVLKSVQARQLKHVIFYLHRSARQRKQSWLQHMRAAQRPPEHISPCMQSEEQIC